MRIHLAAAFVCASAALVVPAQADDAQSGVNLGASSDQGSDPMSPWFFRVGAAELQNLHGLKSNLAGSPFPGTELDYHSIYSVLVEAGYNITPDIAGVLSVGWPPAISAYGAGSINGVGKIVSTTFGPSALTVQYQPFHDGMFRPYIGAGGAYTIIFKTRSAALANAKLTNDLAPEIEAGSDIMFQENLGMFVEVKKAWLSSRPTGLFDGLPFTGTANYAPWVYSTGVTLHL
jgi:outer membrane protein